jgi:hypothetical protein
MFTTASALNVLILTALFFLLGMYKPQWPLFFMKNPNRMIIIIVTTILFMIGMTMYGEGLRQKKLSQTNTPIIEQPTSTVTPLPAEK